MTPRAIGEALRVARKGAGLTQGELARRMGRAVTARDVSRWELTGAGLTRQKLAALLEACRLRT